MINPLDSALPKMVLVAGEDPATRETLSAQLRRDGYQVIALDGLQLCDYLERAQLAKGTTPSPDLILSDVALAGCDSLEICRMICGARDPTPVILLASQDDPEGWGAAQAAGACHVLEKPVDPGELHDAVACYLDRG